MTSNPASSPNPLYKKGDIVKVDLGPIVQDSRLTTKERPSLILRDNTEDPDYCVLIQNDLGNKYADTVILAPITSKQRDKDFKFVVKISSLTSKIPNFKDGLIKLDQIFTIDKKWLKGKMGSLNQTDLELIDKALKFSLGIKS